MFADASRCRRHSSFWAGWRSAFRVVRRIHAAGHEIGVTATDTSCPSAIARCLPRGHPPAKHLLEDISGERVKGYRAPTFSVRRDNWWAYDVLAEEDTTTVRASILCRTISMACPTRRRGRFVRRNSPLAGDPALDDEDRPPQRALLRRRLFPAPALRVSRWCFDRALRQRKSALVFYCHPWEFDPGQPRIQAGREIPLPPLHQYRPHAVAALRGCSAISAGDRMDQVIRARTRQSRP